MAEKQNVPHEAYKTPGKWEWFSHSQLDDSIKRLAVRVPPAYEPTKAYPVFIALSTSNDGAFYDVMERANLEEESLCFDVSGRGFTGGSYVGEACILEILG